MRVLVQFYGACGGNETIEFLRAWRGILEIFGRRSSLCFALGFNFEAFL